MQQPRTIIIGAGPTGLSAAYHLNANSLVLESADRLGGLCRSFKIKDVVFDIGGHSFHTLHDNVRSFVCDDLKVDMFFQRRDARILFRGDVVPYPWQRFFHLIKDRRVIEDCRTGLEKRDRRCRPTNLRNFILATYGGGIAKHFLFPYNRKLWLRNLDEISCTWTSERVAGLRDEPATHTASTQRKPLDENSIVGYPSTGGFDEIFKAIAAKIENIRFNQHVCFIDPQAKVLMTRQGKVFKWKKLISTMPIPDLVGMLDNTPADIIRLASRLPYVSLQVDCFVTAQPLDAVPQRLYCADPEMPAHKLSFNSLSSENQRKEPYHSITAETSIGNMNRRHCRKRTDRILRYLSEAGIIEDRSQVLTHRCELVKYAYPVQSHQVTSIMDLLRRYLECRDIHSLGRFGNWEYVNSDTCLLRGRQLAERLHSKAAEFKTDALSS